MTEASREALEHPDLDAGSVALSELDDHRDRDELRGRYEMFLQEVRVILPGVQVLLAFLLTVPFSNRFGDLDAAGRRGFAVSLFATSVAVLCLMTPSVFHRMADRTARKARLTWGIRMNALGVTSLAIALVAGLWTVSRLAFGATTAWIAAIAFAALLVSVWVLLPKLVIVGSAPAPYAPAPKGR